MYVCRGLRVGGIVILGVREDLGVDGNVLIFYYGVVRIYFLEFIEMYIIKD